MAVECKDFNGTGKCRRYDGKGKTWQNLARAKKTFFSSTALLVMEVVFAPAAAEADGLLKEDNISIRNAN